MSSGWLVQSYASNVTISKDSITLYSSHESYGVAWVLPYEVSVPGNTYKCPIEFSGSSGICYPVQYKANGKLNSNFESMGNDEDWTFTVKEDTEYMLIVVAPKYSGGVTLTATFKGIKQVKS